MDSRKPLPQSFARDIVASDSLRRFQEGSAALDRALRDAPQEFPVPSMLHSSIMRAINQTHRAAEPQKVSMVWRWAAAAAIAALLLAGLSWQRHWLASSPRPDSFASIANAFETGDELTRALPTAVVAPLSDEWARLGRDLNDTGQFLVANLP